MKNLVLLLLAIVCLSFAHEEDRVQYKINVKNLVTLVKAVESQNESKIGAKRKKNNGNIHKTSVPSKIHFINNARTDIYTKSDDKIFVYGYTMDDPSYPGLNDEVKERLSQEIKSALIKNFKSEIVYDHYGELIARTQKAIIHVGSDAGNLSFNIYPRYAYGTQFALPDIDNKQLEKYISAVRTFSIIDTIVSSENANRSMDEFMDKQMHLYDIFDIDAKLLEGENNVSINKKNVTDRFFYSGTLSLPYHEDVTSKELEKYVIHFQQKLENITKDNFEMGKEKDYYQLKNDEMTFQFFYNYYQAYDMLEAEGESNGFEHLPAYFFIRTSLNQ